MNAETEPIITVAQFDALPEGTVLIDGAGWVLQLVDGYWHAPSYPNAMLSIQVAEVARRNDVAPLQVLWKPPADPDRITTAWQLDALSDGTLITDEPGVFLQKREDAWFAFRQLDPLSSDELIGKDSPSAFQVNWRPAS